MLFLTAIATISFTSYFNSEPIPAFITTLLGITATGMVNTLANNLKTLENSGVTIQGKEWLNLTNLLFATKVATGVFGLAAAVFVIDYVSR